MAPTCNGATPRAAGDGRETGGVQVRRVAPASSGNETQRLNDGAVGPARQRASESPLGREKRDAVTLWRGVPALSRAVSR